MTMQSAIITTDPRVIPTIMTPLMFESDDEEELGLSSGS